MSACVTLLLYRSILDKIWNVSLTIRSKPLNEIKKPFPWKTLFRISTYTDFYHNIREKGFNFEKFLDYFRGPDQFKSGNGRTNRSKSVFFGDDNFTTNPSSKKEKKENIVTTV